jgi:hypothetical protein
VSDYQAYDKFRTRKIYMNMLTFLESPCSDTAVTLLVLHKQILHAGLLLLYGKISN